MSTHYSKNGTCCICGGEYTDYGCNPDPVVIDSSGVLRCCLKCNWEKVIPTRISMKEAELKADCKCAFCGQHTETPSIISYQSDYEAWNNELRTVLYLCEDCYDAVTIPIERQLEVAVKNGHAGDWVGWGIM